MNVVTRAPNWLTAGCSFELFVRPNIQQYYGVYTHKLNSALHDSFVMACH